MALSKGQTVTLVAAFGAAILSIMAHIGIREWYSPFLKYSTGSYYTSGTKAVTMLFLTNLGHSDAKGVSIAVEFNNPITNIQSDLTSKSIKDLTYGSGDLTSTFTIPRIVPKQRLFIYFEVDITGKTSSSLNQSFVKEISYSGGIAKTRETYWDEVFGFFGILFAGIFLGMVLTFCSKWADKRLEKVVDDSLKDAEKNMQKIGDMLDRVNRLEDYSSEIDKDVLSKIKKWIKSKED